jgi:asparagine synthase (glutamine-hydrolysing)
MATQSGIFSFDERRATLTQGADGVWIGETRHPVLSRLPSGLAGTFDGRVDNRDDLLRRLGSVPADGVEDARLALGVLDRWGVDGLRWLLGDWGLAVWDAAEGTVHLARDYMGARPLYYCVDSRYAAWSSNLATLVTRTGRTARLNDLFVPAFMSRHLSPEITPYDGIFAVPPGVCVSISANGRATPRRFWTLDAGEIRYPDPRAYEEELYALWREAVQSRLRTGAPVWAELSGGLDSSSIVCMADLLIKGREAPARALHLVSHATLQSPEGDERRFIAEVERQTGIRSEIVGVEDSQDRTDPERDWLTPYALHGVGLEMERRIRAGGGRVVLSGRLGDAIMGCEPDNSVAVHDDLSRGALLTALRNLRGWSRATRKPLVELAWKLWRPDARTPLDTAAALLTPALQAIARDVPRIEPPRGIRRSKRLLARMILAYSAGARLDVPDCSPEVVYAYPFAHRPLVEFMLAIPGDQLSAPGTTRALMRRAFASFVPPRILRRVSKGYYPPAVFRAVRQHVATMLPVNNLEAVQRGWIDAERLRSTIQTFTNGGGQTGGDILAVVQLERWLHARQIRFANPTRKEVNTNEVLHA